MIDLASEDIDLIHPLDARAGTVCALRLQRVRYRVIDPTPPECWNRGRE